MAEELLIGLVAMHDETERGSPSTPPPSSICTSSA